VELGKGSRNAGHPGEAAANEELNPDVNSTLRIYVANKGVFEEMELEAYVCGVVAAEMPASFHPEALKAQAVVARTYAWQKAGPSGGAARTIPGPLSARRAPAARPGSMTMRHKKSGRQRRRIFIWSVFRKRSTLHGGM
jgi:hypothetical protein